MKNLYMNAFVALCSLCWLGTKAQTDTTHYKYGVWQSFGDPLSTIQYPEVQGRLSNFLWADIEPSKDVWDWTEFDSDLTSKAKDGLPIIFLMYTKEDAPQWIYSNGVPKVTVTDDNGNVTGYSPYYQDQDYKNYFRAMIAKVHEHIETLPAYVRQSIIGVQPCFGSTGDYISYKGTVPNQYAISDAEFFTLFKEFTMYYYDEYRNTTPKIYILSNGNNNGEEQTLWVTQNCPGSWIKTGTLGKCYQMNDEKDKASWLFNILNQPGYDGNIMRARSELIGGATESGWWNTAPYKNMFTVMCYAIHWGLDWSNQGFNNISDRNYEPAYDFYNKYAGYKNAATASKGMCMLKDAIDASDVVRFPSSQYGTVARTTTRFNNVLAPFISYGAKLDDANTAISTSEMDLLGAKGINDVAWNVFPGNYERFIHQINANETSSGYWNVQSAQVNTSYGRFARGFDLAKGKDGLYFDVENAFLHNAPLDGAYPVMVEITYLDRGNGKFQLFYDGKENSNSASLAVSCTNTNTWKKASITINDAYFSNLSANGSDFYIKNTGSENVIFTLVEISRAGNGISGSSLFFSGPVTFDTVCVGSTPAAKQLSISGQYLDNTAVVVGPMKGFTFSKSQDAGYADSVILNDYGASFNQAIFVKFDASVAGAYAGSLPINGGGASKINVTINAVAANSLPDVSAALVNKVSCYNAKDGSINLNPSGGVGPLKYSWVNNVNNLKPTTSSISALIPATYTVTMSAAYGCKTTANYVITQPDVLVTTVSADPMLCKGGTTNVYVTAKGGTMPYTGTGTFVKSSGFNTYTVKDSNGCSDGQGFSPTNGSQGAPDKPGIIQGTDADATGVCGNGSYTFTINSVKNATSYTWTAPSKSTVGSTSNGGTNMVLNTLTGFSGGSLTVKAVGACGTSTAQSKTLKTQPAKPGGITGPQTVKSNQAGLKYSTSVIPGITYKWTVPFNAKITSGQNTPSITVTWGTKDGRVRVQAVNDCDNSYNTVVSITVDNTFQQTDTKGTAPTYDLKASPNPARDITKLSFTADVAYRYTIEIANMAGKVVLRKSGVALEGSNNIPVNVSGLISGLYNVTIINNDNGKKITTKLVKG
jgi:hypothetical protein